MSVFDAVAFDSHCLYCARLAPLSPSITRAAALNLTSFRTVSSFRPIHFTIALLPGISFRSASLHSCQH